MPDRKSWRELTDDELVDLTGQWHESPDDGVPLHEFLGMTWAEYKRWTEEPRWRGVSGA